MKIRLLGIYSFLSQMLIIFSFSVLFDSAIGFFFGGEGSEYSSLFSLGNRGMAYPTIFQLLASSFLIQLLKQLFMSEKIIKTMLLLWRTVLLLLSVFIVVGGFIICFKWFPIDSFLGWICFILSYGVCFTAGTLTIVVKTRLESKRYEASLANYRLKQKDKGDM
ncbi:MAG: hypothetical protein ACYDG2_01945 [Ruminiclostridium sp.]